MNDGREPISLTPTLLEEIKALLRDSDIRHGQAFRGIEQGKSASDLAVEWGEKTEGYVRNVMRSVQYIVDGELPTSSKMAYTNSFGYREMWKLGASPELVEYIKHRLRQLRELNPAVTVTPLGKVTFPNVPNARATNAPGTLETSNQHVQLSDVAAALKALHNIKVETHEDGAEAPYQYLVLLWSISAALNGIEQPIPFSVAKPDISPILNRFAIAKSPPRLENPWFALRQSPWWEIPNPVLRYKEVPQSDMSAGLSPGILTLIEADGTFAGRAVAEIQSILQEMLVDTKKIDTLLEDLELKELKRYRLIPVESNVAESFTSSAPEETEQERKRKEAELQNAYKSYLARRGHQVTAIEIFDDGQNLRADLFDVNEENLIEAKSSTRRETVRLGLGQILDYARFVDHKRKTLLLPERPPKSLVKLLGEHDVHVVYREGSGDFVETWFAKPAD